MGLDSIHRDRVYVYRIDDAIHGGGCGGGARVNLRQSLELSTSQQGPFKETRSRKGGVEGCSDSYTYHSPLALGQVLRLGHARSQSVGGELTVGASTGVVGVVGRCDELWSYCRALRPFVCLFSDRFGPFHDILLVFRAQFVNEEERKGEGEG